MVINKQNSENIDLWEKIKKTVSPLKSDKISPATVLDKPSKNTDSKLVVKKIKKKDGYNKPISPKNQNLIVKRNIPTDLRYEGASGIDGSSSRKLKSGKFEIEATLDLHGMTQQKAYSTLQRFIQKCVFNELRTVLVVTGKGPEGKGILRNQFPKWIKTEACAPHILAIGQAQSKDGGSGAFYIRLRRNRETKK